MASNVVKLKPDPAFLYWVVEPDFVVLVDLFDPRRPTMTVTNAVEAVLPKLDLTPSKRVIYRDSDGCWSEILCPGGNFEGFGPVTGLPFAVKQLMRACDGRRVA